MTDIVAAFGWIFDPNNWAGPGGFPARTVEHILYSLLTLRLAAVIALPIGFFQRPSMGDCDAAIASSAPRRVEMAMPLHRG